MNNPFRRKKDVSAVPAEIQDYYQSERRDRTGIAWLLALGTLIVTIGLATLLFFGGRWAYRAVVNNDDTTQEVAQTEKESEESDKSDDSTSTPNEVATPSTGTSSTSTSTPNTPSTTPAPSASRIPNTPTTPTSSVAGSSTGLPNTGPGDIVAIVAITTAVGAAAHYAVSTRRNES